MMATKDIPPAGSQPALAAGTLHIIVRFTTSTPDVELDISAPNKTTVLYLKYLIRPKLPDSVASRRLRFIYSGKILADTATLSSALKLPPPPPRKPIDPKGKGKEKDLDPPPTRVYINCSIGDELTDEEIAAETSAALAGPASKSPSNEEPDTKKDDDNQNTTPAPRGFDRLLISGFSPAEVGQLRLQFMSIQSRMYTPDTMPSQAEFRSMEDAWLDNNAMNGEAAAGGFGNDIAEGSMDVLFWGAVMGFLWPLGAVGWAMREEGIWSRQKKTAVFAGFLFGLVFGAVKVIG
jgi:hypothetical protein